MNEGSKDKVEAQVSVHNQELVVRVYTRYDIDLTDKSFHARVNPHKRQKKSMIIKLLLVALCERGKNVKSHHKRMVRYICVSHSTHEFDALQRQKETRCYCDLWYNFTKATERILFIS